MKIRLFIGLIVIFLISACGVSPIASTGSMQVNSPWVLAAKNGESTAAFMLIKNTGSQADRLVKAKFESAKMTQLMNFANSNGKMSMVNVDVIDIPAGGLVELKSGGFHVMLMGLTKDLIVGDKISLTLTFEKGGTTSVDLPVQTK